MPDLSTVNLAELVPLEQIVFWVMTALTIIGGIGVIASRSLFHSALFLVMSFAGVTGYYILLSAGFLAVVQLTVYIGAIAILILFAIMFSRRTMAADKQGQANQQWWLGLPIVAVMFLILMMVTGAVQWPVSELEPSGDMVEQLGFAFLGSYLIPFEVIGILLSVALIGGVILARDKVKEESQS
jgi:NADH-quinone oxidoreductase subunit J